MAECVPDPRLVDFLREARRVLIFTGVGIPTRSGIPDYRGPQGVWKRRQPVYCLFPSAAEAAWSGRAT